MLAGKTILFADDDEAFTVLYSHILEKAGMKVFTAKDGEEALAIAKQEHPNIVVLDIAMPKKDGLTTTKEIRATDWGKKVPIIILSGKEPELEKVVEVSPTYYFLKGNKSADDFVSTVQDILAD